MRTPASFLAWAAVGACGGFGVLALLTIGLPFVIVAAVAFAILVAKRIHGEAGIITGLAAPVLTIAWLNRGGPGEVCTTAGTGTSCVDAWSPLPFLVVGATMALAGVVASVLLSRSTSSRTARDPRHRPR